VTGFPFYNPPCQRLDPELDDFMAAGDPPIVFTLGTTAVNDPGSFYEESIAAVRRLGRRAVLLVGRRNGNGVHSLSPDVMAVAYAPHEPLFARAAAIVHQGGIGTLSEAMRAGKPALIMPYGHDQADNAWRASQLGVAKVISRRNYRAATAQKAIDHILHDPSYVQSASGIARAIAQERGAIVAADLVEETLQAPDLALDLAALSYV
jgi:UDP:flavonoid glycosyltransferase YjiC (YdhE family)